MMYEDDCTTSSSNDDDVVSSDDEITERLLWRGNKHHDKKNRRRNEATYGVFWDDDEEKPSGRASKKKRTRKQESVEMMFVKGETLVESDEKEKEQKAEQKVVLLPAAAADLSKVEEDEDEEIERRQQQQQRQEQEQADAANELFLSLLNAGRGRDAAVTTSSTNKRQEEVAVKRGADIRASSDERNHDDMTVPGLGIATTTASFSTVNATSAAPGLGVKGNTTTASSKTAASTTTSNSSHMMPLQFGRASSQLSSSSSSRKKKTTPDPTIGTWERHTKGIGMKLLQKMGYTGRGGLSSGRARPHGDETKKGNSSKQEGIAKPVSVKVRPANLGLGYGNFKEATSSVNKNRSSTLKSSISAQDTLQQQRGWKKNKRTHTDDYAHDQYGESAKKKKKGAQRRNFVPYRELLEKNEHQQTELKIIDMRGPSIDMDSTATMEDGSGSGGVVAQEVLHNLSLLLSTHETKMYSASHFLKHQKTQSETLQNDIASLQQQLQTNQQRQDKLARMLEKLDEIETVLTDNNNNNNNNESSSSLVETMPRIVQLVASLGCTFTDDERKSLKFNSVIVPSLLGTVLEGALAKWNPIRGNNDGDDDTMIHSKQLLETALLLNMDCNDEQTSRFLDNDDNRVEIQNALLTQYVLPRIKRLLESSSTLQGWDPITDYTNKALRLFELLDGLLLEKAQRQHGESAFVKRSDTTRYNDNEHNIFPTIDDCNNEASSTAIAELSDLVRKEIVCGSVYQRLVRALRDWKPQLETTHDNIELKDRPDLWILPWLPYLANDQDKTLIPSLVADCKRTIKSALAFLQKSLSDGRAVTSFLNACTQSLRPWRGVFKKSTIQSLVSTFVTPRLARYLSKCTITVQTAAGEESAGQWIAVDYPFQMHSLGLLSDAEFFSVLEGELLPNWAAAVQAHIVAEKSKDNNSEGIVSCVAESYAAWKLRCFGSNEEDDTASTLSFQLVRNDNSICRCFYAVLLQIQALASSNDDDDDDTLLDELCPAPDTINYRIVLARRKAEEKRQAADELLRMEEESGDNGIETRVRLNHGKSNYVPTFRDVVEEYARERDILFQPRLGNNAMKDGKQVFLFGKVPIYLDSNVAYAWQPANGAWQPMSLDDIAQIAGSK